MKKEVIMAEKGYNIIQASKLLGLQVSTVRTWARTGRIKAKKIAGSNRWVILESEILRLQGLQGEEHENKSGD